DVGLRVATDDLCLELLAAEQLHHDLVGVLDHVVVGQDEPLRVDDEARAQALRFEGPARRAEEGFERAVEVLEGVVLAARSAGATWATRAAWSALAAERVARLHLLRARDVHHRGRDVLRQRGKVWQRDGRSLRRGRGLLLVPAEQVERLAVRQQVGSQAHGDAHHESDERRSDESPATGPPAHAPSLDGPRTSSTYRMRRS